MNAWIKSNRTWKKWLKRTWKRLSIISKLWLMAFSFSSGLDTRTVSPWKISWKNLTHKFCSLAIKCCSSIKTKIHNGSSHTVTSPKKLLTSSFKMAITSKNGQALMTLKVLRRFLTQPPRLLLLNPNQPRLKLRKKKLRLLLSLLRKKSRRPSDRSLTRSGLSKTTDRQKSSFKKMNLTEAIAFWLSTVRAPRSAFLAKLIS